MDWVKSAFGLSSATVASPPSQFDESGLKITTPEEENLCLTCKDPCELHDQIPTLLAMKINQSKPLLGTVKPYGIQLVLSTGTFDWEAKIEKTDGTFANVISKELKSKKDSLPSKVLLTAGSSTSSSNDPNILDILVFPSMIRFNSVHKDQISSWISSGLFSLPSSDPSSSSSSPSQESSPSSITPSSFPFDKLDKKTYVLICTHKKRDKRCGVIGPMLVDEFQRILREKGMDQDVGVLGVSHFGGHKFAGNVIVYPGGVWYGRVTACDVEVIVQKHIVEGKIVRKYWRGILHEESKEESSEKKW